MISAALRSARRAPVLSAVMVLALTHSVAFWMLAESSHDVETRHLRALHPNLNRVLLDTAAKPLPGTDAWLPAHWSALLLDPKTARSLIELAPRAVIATFDTRLPARGGTGQLAEVNVRFTTAALFTAFDRPLVHGRAWIVSEAREVVVRADTAQRWFGRDDVVGESVELDGQTFTIAGVVREGDGEPYDLTFSPDNDEVFVPFALAATLGATPDLSVPGGGYVNVWAELPPGELPALAERLGPGFSLMPYRELWERASLSDPAVELFRGFAVIAVVACAFNLMRLLATRFLLQAPATAVRRALGATRLRLFSVHVLEATLLAAVAAALAPPLAWLGTVALNHLLLRRVGEYRIDARLVLAGAAVALVTGALASLWPAARAARVAPAAHLRSS